MMRLLFDGELTPESFVVVRIGHIGATT